MAETLKEKREARRNRKNTPAADVATVDETVEDKGLTESKGRATPSRRKGETQHARHDTTSGNIVVRSVSSMRNYFNGVRSEISKVTWPTREETQRLSWIVAAVLVASSLVLGALAGLFTYIFNLGVEQPLIFIGVFIAFLVLLFVYARFTSQTEGPEF